jgi:hypothetical protein
MAVVAEAMRRSTGLEPMAKDADALTLGATLSVQVLVVGSYQVVGGRIGLACRLLNSSTARVMGDSVNISTPYPDGYFEGLSQVTTKVLAALRMQPTAAEARGVGSALKGTRVDEAQRSYNTAVSRVRDDTVESLTQAIALFDKTIEQDPNYALAYAAKADAQLRLAELKKLAGNDTPDLAKDALDSAERAIKAAPDAGRGYRSLANAQNALGNYEAAAAAARRAIEYWPSDALTYFTLGRAEGRGVLAPNPSLDKAMQLQPGLVLGIQDCPKVTVVNNSSSELTATFAFAQRNAYPPVQIPVAASRVVAVLPGQFMVSITGEGGGVFKEYTFEPGNRYTLTFTTIITSTGPNDAGFKFRNLGDVPATVQISGDKNGIVMGITVKGGETKGANVPPGTYSVSVALPGAAPSSAPYTLKAGDEETLEFRIQVQYRIRQQ